MWSPSLGDQVSLVSVTAQGAELTEPVPAVDLTDGSSVAVIGASPGYPHQLAPDYYVGIVPDGVARVRASSASESSARTPTSVIGLPVRYWPRLLSSTSRAGPA